MNNFTGLPIPAAAAGAVSLNLLLLSPFLNLNQEVRAIILVVMLFFLGYMMVSRWKFPSFKALNFKLHSFQLVFVTVILALFFLYGALYFFSIALALASWGYIFIGLIFAIIRKIAGKKSSTLKDFEPDEEEDEEK